jgi:hypothetical protein
MSGKSKGPIRAYAAIPWRKRFYWRPKILWLKRQRAHRASKHAAPPMQHG